MEKNSKSLSGRYIEGNHIESQDYRTDDVTRDLKCGLLHHPCAKVCQLGQVAEALADSEEIDTLQLL